VTSSAVPVQVITLPPETLQPTASPRSAFRITPGEVPPQWSFLTDRSSAPLAKEGRTIGDYYPGNLLERPLNAEDLEYRGDLDIAPGAELALLEPWIYVTLRLAKPPAPNQSAKYGVEFDLDFDGRGDYLLWSDAPQSTEWSREGIEIFTDVNKDVGGSDPMQHDESPGDGYETLVLGGGTGIDPDTAWMRKAGDEDTFIIQYALKHTLFSMRRWFAWGVLADGGLQDPSRMDYNDQFTPEEAGSPVITDKLYPLGVFDLFDNSCRSLIGSPPRSGVPGLCPLVRPTSTEEPTEIPATPEPTP